jgi:hypothetical protein
MYFAGDPDNIGTFANEKIHPFPLNLSTQFIMDRNW